MYSFAQLITIPFHPIRFAVAGYPLLLFVLSNQIMFYHPFTLPRLKINKNNHPPNDPSPKIKWHTRYTLKHISLHWASFNSGKPYPYICLSTHLHLHTRSRVPHISRWWISKCNNRGGGKSTGRFKRKGQDGITWAPENRRHYTCTGAN